MPNRLENNIAVDCLIILIFFFFQIEENLVNIPLFHRTWINALRLLKKKKERKKTASKWRSV